MEVSIRNLELEHVLNRYQKVGPAALLPNQYADLYWFLGASAGAFLLVAAVFFFLYSGGVSPVPPVPPVRSSGIEEKLVALFDQVVGRVQELEKHAEFALDKIAFLEAKYEMLRDAILRLQATTAELQTSVAEVLQRTNGG